jgi:hypothetical protein
MRLQGTIHNPSPSRRPGSQSNPLNLERNVSAPRIASPRTRFRVTLRIFKTHREDSEGNGGVRLGPPDPLALRVAGNQLQTVTFPWWVPKTERITSEISPSVA